VKTLLFVDDESQILRCLSRLFSDSGHRILCAGSGVEALNICAETKVDLIVSDMRMPEMNGVELLSKVKQAYPQSLRVILSGYSDEGLVIDALQNNITMTYLLKPWDNDELCQTIEKVLDTGSLLSSAALLTVINAMGHLPTLKPYLQEILDTIDSDDDIATIGRKIEKDHTISSKILHIANSAYYGIKTGSIKTAVSFLGLQIVKNLIRSMSVMDAFEIPGYGRYYAEKLWTHSFETSNIQKAILSSLLPRSEMQMVISAGLLHNIGIAFLLKNCSTEYLPLVKETINNPSTSLSSLELEQFGFTHAQVGGYLLQWWNLPFPIVEAALYHDNPTDTRVINKKLVCATHIAQWYASNKLGMNLDCTWQPEAFASLGNDMERIDEILKTAML